MTPDPEGHKLDQFTNQLVKSLISGIRLVQFRAKTLTPEAYKELAVQVMATCKRYDATLILNAAPEIAEELDAEGVHLNGERLSRCAHRPLHSDKLVSVACHSLEQIRKAELIGADMVTLSPVLPTESHPEEKPLGWKNFSLMAKQTALPVFALGGMNGQLLDYAHEHGAYGIAGIRSFWSL